MNAWVNIYIRIGDESLLSVDPGRGEMIHHKIEKEEGSIPNTSRLLPVQHGKAHYSLVNFRTRELLPFK